MTPAAFLLTPVGQYHRNWLFHAEQISPDSLWGDGTARTTVCFVEYAYWKKYGHLEDRSITAYLLLPTGDGILREVTDSVFESNLDIDAVVRYLRFQGFSRNPTFTRFCLRHPPDDSDY